MEQKTREKHNLGGMAFLPLIVFLALYIGCGLTFTMMGVESPFGKMPRHVALLGGMACAFVLCRKMSVQEKLDTFCKGMGNSGVMTIVLIYLMAGGFQGAAAASGGKESVVNLALHFIPVTLLIPGVFLVCCLISTAIGTSMGTIAAMAPIAMSVAVGAGLNPAVCGAAVIGGAYFGDNLSMISDTTISAAEGCGSEMRDKFKMNFWIALPAALIAMILYAVIGGKGSGVIESGSFNVLLTVPYITVLVTALMGLNVAVVLFIGIAMTAVFGILTGHCTVWEWVAGLGGGMSDMFSISIAAILIAGLIEVIRAYGGVEWLVGKITGSIHDRKGAEYSIGLLSGILSAALVNNTLGIIITCPMAKEIGGKYGIAPKRLASLVDIFACAFLALMPHDGGMLIITGLADVSPLEVMKYSFYMFALIIAVCVTIQMGLLRTPEEKNFEAAQK